jgi:hypothetical protein
MKSCVTIVGVCTLLALIFSINGCVCREKGRYYNDQYRFSLVVPENWERRDDFLGAVVAFISPAKDSLQFRSNFNIIIEENSAPLSLTDYSARIIDDLKKTYPDIVFYDEGMMEFRNGTARWMVHSYTLAGIRIKVIEYLVVNGEQGIIITGSSDEASFPQFRSTFDGIAASFRIEKD